MMQRFNNQKVRCQVSGVRCEREGFSLLEIVIVIAILGILAPIGFGYYGNVVKDIDLNLSAKSMVSDIKVAQAKAMAGNGDNNWGICFRNPSSGDDRYEIVSPVSTCSESTAANSKTAIFLQNGIVFTDPAPSAAKSVTFNRITGATTSGSDITVTVSLNGQTKTITITPAGLISSS